MTHVLVVDDDAMVREVVLSYLRAEKYDVSEASDGEEALALFAHQLPDLVVLDVMLPGIDGLEVCRRMRATTTLPIIMLTALGSESDRVVGLELGADDYVTKPFSPRELVLRVGSVLRRAGEKATPDSRVLVDGDLTVDGPSRETFRGGEPLALTLREFELLRFFMANPDVAFTRVDLLERVWGWSFGDQSTVTVHVRRLREKVEPDPASPTRLVTVWGVGYRWTPSASDTNRWRTDGPYGS
jgi:DNA-binding response OmpR family regulator